MQKNNNFIFFSYCSLLFFIPISTFLTNIALGLFFIFALIFGKLKYSLKRSLFTSLFLFFAYIVILGFVNLNFETKEYIKLIPLLLIPLPMTFLVKEKLYKGLTFLFIAVLIKQLVAVYGIMDYYMFTEGKTVALRSYAGINDILKFERPYLGFFSAINIIIAYKVIKKKALFVATVIFSIAIIVLISARLGLIIAVLIIIALYLYNYKSYAKYVLSFVLIGLLSLILTNNPLKNRFQQLKYDTRLVIWKGALDVYQNNPNPIFGLKNQKALNNSLVDYYQERAYFDYQPDKNRFLSKKYNTHNQYINEFLRGGIVGVILIMIPFLISIVINFREKDLTAIMLTLSILIFFLVENLLARQIGVYITAIILGLTRISKYEKN
ncbi:O-antigen ligase family protein [Winogradskyella sp.]|uniref:O-antigen ligase family protein n=1 Tax=Winogradskyella sp. TaxID=1883156 RepID=UPI00261ECDBE|nr:O-antigen ligase family protein [uncultured Winogradskyella sp.]